MREYVCKAGAFLRLVRAKLGMLGVADPGAATPMQWYTATVAASRDMLERRREHFMKECRRDGGKRVAYFCMEFLIGRMLTETLESLGAREELEEALKGYGVMPDAVYNCEADPGLGNGGLGRLAACFMDSLSACSYPAIGYSLCYETGLFRQRLVDGAQVELPDEWWSTSGAWLIPRPEMSVSVCFGGQISERFEGGHLHIVHTEYDEVLAVPYDILIPGGRHGGVNVLRLWRAQDPRGREATGSTQAGYIMALNERSAAEELTRSLYPPDQHEAGKLLRLSQQYFLVSASLQNLIAEHFAEGGALSGLADRVAIHINDTHPALAVPELMRILMDVYSYSWEDAFATVRRMTSYTNHTVMPEALECWRADLFRMKLPRLFAIVCELNRRQTESLWRRYPGDWDRISRMAILAYGQVRMANLAILGAHTVNGVSRLHSDILRSTVFSDFYQDAPESFTSVTNGVTHRRWLEHANRPLCTVLDELIGEGYRKSPELLEGLTAFRDDTAVCEKILAIKRGARVAFSDYLADRGYRWLDPDAVFDVQIKRMHEYKRQLLNVLKILSLLLDTREGHPPSEPIVFLFGAKAARGYEMAKESLRLILALSDEIANDPVASQYLSVVFCEEYNVTLAEHLIPAADISEQISLAGKEASGTGCMKLMMNGALTLGTADGANVEIRDAVGPEAIYMFGLNHREVEELWRRGYDARSYYRASERLHAAVDRLYSPIGGRDFSHIGEYLISGNRTVADPFLCLADFEAYRTAFDRMLADRRDPIALGRRMLINIARSGRFSSDRCIREYAEHIWHLRPVGE